MPARSLLAYAPVVTLAVLVMLTGCDRSNGTTTSTPAESVTSENGDATALTTPTAPIAPSYWYPEEKIIAGWQGKSWRDIDILQFIEDLPEDLDEGTQYITLFRRSCDHCETMINQDLAPDASLARRVLLVEVPEDKKTFRAEGAWPMPEGLESRMSRLPLGTNWIMTTPFTIALKDGVVTCVEEGDHKGCMGLP